MDTLYVTTQTDPPPITTRCATRTTPSARGPTGIPGTPFPVARPVSPSPRSGALAPRTPARAPPRAPLGSPCPVPGRAGNSVAATRPPAPAPAATTARRPESAARGWGCARRAPRRRASTTPGAPGRRPRRGKIDQPMAPRRGVAGPRPSRFHRLPYGLVRRCRVFSGGDRAADHEMCGAAAHRHTRGDRAPLVARAVPGEPHTRHHDPRPGAERFAQQPQLLT